MPRALDRRRAGRARRLRAADRLRRPRRRRPRSRASGSNTLTRPAMPSPSRVPTSSSMERATASPARAATTTAGSVGRLRRVAPGPAATAPIRSRRSPSTRGSRTRTGPRRARRSGDRSRPRSRALRAPARRRARCRRRSRCRHRRRGTSSTPAARAGELLTDRGGRAVVVDHDRHPEPLRAPRAGRPRARRCSGRTARGPFPLRPARRHRHRPPTRPVSRTVAATSSIASSSAGTSSAGVSRTAARARDRPVRTTHRRGLRAADVDTDRLSGSSDVDLLQSDGLGGRAPPSHPPGSRSRRGTRGTAPCPP